MGKMNKYNLTPRQMADAIYKVIVEGFSAAVEHETQIRRDIESIIANGIKEKMYLPFTRENLKLALDGILFVEDSETEWKHSETHRIICIDSHLTQTKSGKRYPIVTLDEKGFAHYWCEDGSAQDFNNKNQLHLFVLENTSND